MSMDVFAAMIGGAIISIASGITTLVWPKLLGYVVRIYIIFFGLIGAFLDFSYGWRIAAAVAIAGGIVSFIWPKLLAHIIAICLIVVGLISRIGVLGGFLGFHDDWRIAGIIVIAVGIIVFIWPRIIEHIINNRIVARIAGIFLIFAGLILAIWLCALAIEGWL